jgi:hypothetical protein
MLAHRARRSGRRTGATEATSGGAGGCKKIMATTFSVETMVGPSSLPARAGKAASEKSGYRLRELVKNL